MASGFFRFIDCTNKRLPRRTERSTDVAIRLAQWTDPHMPGPISLARRLRDLARPHATVSNLSHELSAISNEFSQPYRVRRKMYANLIRKLLVGLEREDVDHLCITGDLAHCGMADEFIEIKTALQITGWTPERTTVIAGNHDRFNLYETIPNEPMERFFDVVTPRHPRIKIVGEHVAIAEIDSNSDRVADRHRMERWLPNTIGRIYPETISALDAQRDVVGDRRLIVMLHHHLSTDWYPPKAGRDLGGLMGPAEGVDALVDWAHGVDARAIFLHGHIHEAMPVGYMYRGHMVGNPGGFAQSHRVNLIDVYHDRRVIMTQIELRHGAL